MFPKGHCLTVTLTINIAVDPDVMAERHRDRASLGCQGQHERVVGDTARVPHPALQRTRRAHLARSTGRGFAAALPQRWLGLLNCYLYGRLAE